MNTHPIISSRNFTAFADQELDGNIIARFRTIVAAHTQCIAIKDRKRTFDYGALEHASNRMAQTLLDIFGDVKEAVALMYKPGAAYTIAQLAVLKTGKFYATIDHDLQHTRQAFLLDDLRTRVLLCDRHCLDKAVALAQAFPELKVINTDAVITCERNHALATRIKSSDAACIVYTSGSTGPARGVVFSHQNILALAKNHGRDFGLNICDKASQLCPVWSAAGTSEIFSALLNGVALFPFSINEHGVEAYLQLIVNEGITTMTVSPVLFRLLFSGTRHPRGYPSVRLIRLGGDRATSLDLELYRRHFADSCVLRVSYGSTEFMQATQLFIDKTYAAGESILPVGFAMQGCELLVLDDDGKEVAQGQAGEIAVKSSNLSQGYWRNSLLTESRFIHDTREPAKRIYLTRDIGYQDPDGCLHHVGRKDSRVKIYGKMVLVSDIERALLGIRGVGEAVVIPFDSGERGTALAAFVMLADKSTTTAFMRTELAKKIGRDLVPAKFSILDNMPIQPGNKINRLKLKAIADRDYGRSVQVSGIRPHPTSPI